MSIKEMSLVSRLLQLAKKFNSFYLEVSSHSSRGVYPFVVAGHLVGLIRQEMLSTLRRYPEVFVVTDVSVSLHPSMINNEERTKGMESALRDIRRTSATDVKACPRICRTALAGWRDEYYDVKNMYSSESLLKIDRSATCLFGICKYGVEIVGYVKDPDKGLSVWLQKRSTTKETWPGKWDNMVSGGLSVGFTVLETAMKEAKEEASIPDELLSQLRPAGSVSFFFECERGLFPNTEFVYDLELPMDFVPTNRDGEVELFELVPLPSALERLFSTQFKTTSCPVFIDFLIRHGIISPDNEPDYPQLVELLHVPLQNFYSQQPYFIKHNHNNNDIDRSEVNNSHSPSPR